MEYILEFNGKGRNKYYSNLGHKMIKVAKAVIENKERYLLLKRSNQSKFFPGQWDFPRGKLEENEDSASAVILEVKEETAMEIKLGSLILEREHKEQDKIIYYSIFKVISYSGMVRLSKDHIEYAWLSKEEIKDYPTTPFIKKIF